MDVATREARRLFAGSQPSWRLGSIAFIRDGDVWIADADGSRAHAVVTDDAVQAAPDLSPDGTRVAYHTDAEPPEVIVVDIQTGARVVVGSGKWARWSPDGSEIVFIPDWGLSIYTMADGSLRRVENAPADDTVAWSSDGSLYFAGVGFDRTHRFEG